MRVVAVNLSNAIVGAGIIGLPSTLKLSGRFGTNGRAAAKKTSSSFPPPTRHPAGPPFHFLGTPPPRPPHEHHTTAGFWFGICLLFAMAFVSNYACGVLVGSGIALRQRSYETTALVALGKKGKT